MKLSSLLKLHGRKIASLFLLCAALFLSACGETKEAMRQAVVPPGLFQLEPLPVTPDPATATDADYDRWSVETRLRARACYSNTKMLEEIFLPAP